MNMKAVCSSSAEAKIIGALPPLTLYAFMTYTETLPFVSRPAKPRVLI